MRAFRLGLLVACLAAVGCAEKLKEKAQAGKKAKKVENKTKKKKVVEKEAPAATSWQVSEFNSNLTLTPQGGNFVVIPKGEGSTDLTVYECDRLPCLPSKITTQPANVSVDIYQGYGKFKVWIPEVPDDYKWSLGWKVKFDLDPEFDQRIYKAEVNGQDMLADLKSKGALVLQPSEGGQSIEVEVLSLKGGAFSECGWDGDDCFEGKCCKSAGMTCYLKDDFWGMCRPTGSCTPGIDEADGQKWLCTDVGSRPDVEPLPPAPAKDAAGASLFCFTVTTPLTYEPELVDAQKAAGAGIFGCDQSGVYLGAETDPASKALVIKDWLAIWAEVTEGGLWKKTDWTVKAEPDTAFSAARVRARLSEMSPYDGTAIYFKNFKEGVGLPTPFMMFSKTAVELLLKDKEDCKTKVERRKGESFYLSTCLDASGAGYMLDPGLIDDRRNGEEHLWDMTDTSGCTNEGIVAYRPFQQAEHWLDCSKKAEKAAAKLMSDRL